MDNNFVGYRDGDDSIDLGFPESTFGLLFVVGQLAVSIASLHSVTVLQRFIALMDWNVDIVIDSSADMGIDVNSDVDEGDDNIPL